MSNELLSRNQHGFVSGRSTVTQLLQYLNRCVDIMSHHGVIDVVYLDFARAFDSVTRLISKLRSYGIGGCILNWIKALLHNRTQVVKVNGKESFIANVLSGIPQGSVLGPFLFVIYINGLPDTIKSDLLLFADDTNIFKEISAKDDSL